MGKKFRKLKAYRQLKNVKQSDLAKLLGISLNSYNFKENGKQQFTLEEAKKISDFFNTTIEDIFFTNEVNEKFTRAVVSA